MIRATYFLVLFSFGAFTATAQYNDNKVVKDDYYVMGDAGSDPSPELDRYERLNKTLGSDSVRFCDGQPCIGWVEDAYPNGTLKHKGYYDGGELVVYKNYHTNGAVERDFKQLDNVKSVLRSYHDNGQLRSEARYANGVSYQYEDHYVDGTLRYLEEKHRKQPYYIRMDLYAADGKTVSKLELVDKKNVEFLQQEFHPGGALKSEGRARYDKNRMDSQRIGTWKFYDLAGRTVKEEDYYEGKLATVR